MVFITFRLTFFPRNVCSPKNRSSHSLHFDLLFSQKCVISKERFSLGVSSICCAVSQLLRVVVPVNLTPGSGAMFPLYPPFPRPCIYCIYVQYTYYLILWQTLISKIKNNWLSQLKYFSIYHNYCSIA